MDIRILKYSFFSIAEFGLNNYEVENYSQAKELLDAVIRIYNNERPHMSIGYITPEKVHSKELKKGDCKWKNYYKKKEIVNQF